eukprot:augustus_masked-scaffold_2-processed-gene-5.47-mRNA-1 protein AED:0.26 eAED:0.30 QI:0/-1/0/1/-1/1/1/0/351
MHEYKPVVELPENINFDVIGDIHGEFGALVSLLNKLEYNVETGRHEENRKIVFLGDLVDRGPDSPSVLNLVSKFVKNGSAFCILGNHELNILLNKRKHGNAWFFGEREEAPLENQTLFPSGDSAEKSDALAFLSSLPIVLRTRETVFVHACLCPESIQKVSSQEGNFPDAAAMCEFYADSITAAVDYPSSSEMEQDLRRQNNNPVKVLTSGKEQVAKKEFFAGGKWRKLERNKWWETPLPQSVTPVSLVVIGHYWRYNYNEREEGVQQDEVVTGDDPFADFGIDETVRIPVEDSNNIVQALCIDFSVGARFSERAVNRHQSAFGTALCCLRLPEKILISSENWQCQLKETC